MSSRVREKGFGCPIVGFTCFWVFEPRQKSSVVTEILFVFLVKMAHIWGCVVYFFFLQLEGVKKAENETKGVGL